MHRFFIVLIVLGLLAGACGGGDAAATPPTTAEPTTTSTTTTVPPKPAPDQLAEQLFAARSGNDPAVWRSLLTADSPAFEALDWAWLDDFDGDGVVSFADWVQFQIALNDSNRARGDWECEQVSESSAECTVALTDAFYELAGGSPEPAMGLLTFENGLLVGEEYVGETSDQSQELEGARQLELERYEEWVGEAHVEAYSGLFAEPCCGEWVTLPSAVPYHARFMPEYLDTVAG